MNIMKYSGKHKQRVSRWQYDVREETVNLPEIGACRTYGLQEALRMPGRTVILGTVHDVTPNRDRAEDLAQCFTRRQLSPLHLRDVLEDCLT